MPLEVYVAAGAVMLALPLVLYAAGAGEKLEARSNPGMAAMPKTSPTNMREVRLQQRATDRVLAPMADALARKVRRFTPTGMIEGMERKINVAGVASTWTVERLLATKLFFGVIGTSLGLYILSRGLTTKTVVMAVLLSAGSFIFPDMQLDRRGKDRAKVVEKELPDMLDQMTIGVEAGLGFDAALIRVARENKGPLADEFGRMMQDRQLGMGREEAFIRIVDRTDCKDLQHFVLALTQADKHGMPLATVLRVQADEMRQKRRTRAEEKALSLPVKIVLPLVLCILPALFIVILGPAAFRMSGGAI